MKVLNLSSDYSKQGIYVNLAQHIANDSDVHQDIYVPVRSEKELGVNRPNHSNIHVTYHYILSKKDSVFYKHKISKVYKDVQNTYKLSTYNLIHAHFMFSDGGVAYKIWKSHQIPYIVAVRNTDINFFLKYAIHLRSFGRDILLNAKRIVLLSPAYVDLLLESFNPEIRAQLSPKIEVIPNGIDDYWFKEKVEAKLKPSEVLTLLYVGDFSKNKNIPFLIKAKQKYFPRSVLNIVGANGADDQEIKSLAEADGQVKLRGRIADKKLLKDYYREADILCILSQYETFGLSYIEAMSQGTPVMFTEGQGIDGYFQDPTGYAVPFGKDVEFEKAVKSILENYARYSKNALASMERFRWRIIANEYIKLYEQFGS